MHAPSGSTDAVCGLPVLYEAADLANRLRMIGSKCRTPAAVRERVRRGFMHPTHCTPRGVHLWDSDAAGREIDAERLWIRCPYLRLVREEPRQMSGGWMR